VSKRLLSQLATSTAVVAYATCLAALPALRELLDDQRALGRILLVVVAVTAGIAASSPRNVAVRSLLLLACAVVSLLAMVRDTEWNFADVHLRESASLSTIVVVALLVSVQPRVPRVIAALVLAAIVVWTLVGLVSPYAQPLADSEQSWLLFSGAALGFHLSRPR
jgi:uncharacterized membrane protein